MFPAVGPPGGRGRAPGRQAGRRSGQTASLVSASPGASLDEAGAVAEAVAAGARQGRLRLLALLRGVAGEGLRSCHLRGPEPVTWRGTEGGVYGRWRGGAPGEGDSERPAAGSWGGAWGVVFRAQCWTRLVSCQKFWMPEN